MQNLIQADLTQSQVISRFYGLNRLEKGRSGEFKAMLGLSSDRYPCMAAARQAKQLYTGYTNIHAVIAQKYGENIEGLTGVANGVFYYNGAAKTKDSATIPANADVTLVDFNGRIIICAYDGTNSYMSYYDYTATGTNKVKNMETTVIGTMTVYGSGDPSRDVTVTNYIERTGGWTGFKMGDSVQISGFVNAGNNTQLIDSKFDTADKTIPISAVVEKVDGNKLYVQLYNYLRERLVFTNETAQTRTVGNVTITPTVKIGIPVMNHICIHNNRLWGTNPNGEYIYASKLGDPFNWNTYQGLANDSYYAEIGTAGGFVGIVSYRDNLVAFKRDYIHHIYGDKPSNYSIPKQLSDCGCIDIKSAVQIGVGLYFLGYNGFYVYQGGQPELISQKLDKTYEHATAATDGQKYIVSCEDGLLVYDTRYGTWHIEEDIQNVKGYFRRENKVYIATDTKLYQYGGNDAGYWSAETIIFTENTFENKGLIEIWIRAILDEDSYIDVKTAEDGGDYVGSFRISTPGLNRHKIPVRHIDGDYYAMKFIGHGNAVITDIEKKYVVAGREFRQNGGHNVY
ncbi:MAG: hypothetical protein IJH17_04725 [Clostridia bacterium]|nr:hypothetical protein [Clostridia bacterium]